MADLKKPYFAYFVTYLPYTIPCLIILALAIMKEGLWTVLSVTGILICALVVLGGLIAALVVLEDWVSCFYDDQVEKVKAYRRAKRP